MKLMIAAVGRVRQGDEAPLIEDYLLRCTKAGRNLGLGPASVVEVEDRKAGGIAAEASLLKARIPDGAVVVALDERGEGLSSPQFAQRLARWRDAGQRDCIFLIGGADGLSPELRADADMCLSFGPMVWPHMLARVMLAEQLYRAVSILSGSPYHRV